jgi:hypothetical protein
MAVQDKYGGPRIALYKRRLNEGTEPDIQERRMNILMDPFRSQNTKKKKKMPESTRLILQ